MTERDAYFFEHEQGNRKGEINDRICVSLAQLDGVK